MRPVLRRHDAGFTLVELLISTAIMMIVTGAIFTVLTPSQRGSQAQPETADMQQRMRVGAETLFKELVMAGAGPYQGNSTGSLVNFFAPILPRRLGRVDPDPTTGADSAKTDTITLIYIPNSYSQTTISDRMPVVAAELKVLHQSNCPTAKALCGFEVGMDIVIFDKLGNFDTFSITEVQEAAGHMQHRQQDLNHLYEPGAQVTEIVSNTYYLNRDTNQLMRYDALFDDIAIVDDVVDLRFDYYGDPQPPMFPRPDPLGTPTSPGAANCLYDADGSYIGPGVLTPTDGSLVALTSADFTDGPFCGSGPNVFDADLLRIRKIRVSLRMQAAAPGLRGADTTLFRNPGTAREAARTIPDYLLTFEVSPRNLNLAR
jgi:hypothetical protein